MEPKLNNQSIYGVKDQQKSDRANKFIGRGSILSSTHKYALAWGDLANCGYYSDNDIVFVSAEGCRKGRIDPDFREIQSACENNVTFVTDIVFDRERPYNKGERQVAEFLVSQNYFEYSPGTWKKKNQ